MNVNREMLAFLRKQYPVGTRIRLDSMQDPYAPVEAGTTGKLDYIDDAGQFHMKWDNGRVLALIPGVDDLIRELRRQGNNLNQLVVMARQGHVELVNMEPFMEVYENTWQTLNSLLSRVG